MSENRTVGRPHNPDYSGKYLSYRKQIARYGTVVDPELDYLLTSLLYFYNRIDPKPQSLFLNKFTRIT